MFPSDVGHVRQNDAERPTTSTSEQESAIGVPRFESTRASAADADDWLCADDSVDSYFDNDEPRRMCAADVKDSLDPARRCGDWCRLLHRRNIRYWEHQVSYLLFNFCRYHVRTVQAQRSNIGLTWMCLQLCSVVTGSMLPISGLLYKAASLVQMLTSTWCCSAFIKRPRWTVVTEVFSDVSSSTHKCNWRSSLVEYFS